MEILEAVEALSALAYPRRLVVFRILVEAGSAGLTAGEIAARTEALPNTTSASLSLLEGAGLVTSRREGRSIRYFANLAEMSELIGFLVDDCCRGRPEVCGFRSVLQPAGPSC